MSKMDYYDRKQSKFRSDRYEDSRSSSKSYYDHDGDRYYDNGVNQHDDYYSNKRPSKFEQSKSRSRSRSRSRSKAGNGDKHTYNDSGSSSNSYYYNDGKIYQDADENSGYNSYNNSSSSSSNEPSGKQAYSNEPSRTIMLKQLPFQMDDDELHNQLDYIRVPYREIRLVKHRDTGASRGFAFVEFDHVDDAQSWMDQCRGSIMFPKYDNRVQLYYSNSNDDHGQNSRRSSYGNSNNNRSNRSDLNRLATDWDCAKCGIKNFKRRDKCFKCGISREESDRRKGGDGFDYTGSTPCNTLVLRNLDALTTEDTIIEAFNKLTNQICKVKNCHIAREPLTNVSSGFAFLEFSSIKDASSVLQSIFPTIEIDGKLVHVDYSKNSFKTAITQWEANSKITYQQLPPEEANSQYSSHAHSHSHPRHHQSHTINSRVNQTDQTNSAAAVALAAIQSIAKKQELVSQITSSMKHQAASETEAASSSSMSYMGNQSESNKMYATPDVTKFTYDETSGYYYDYTTGFYYDATSQYYFNPLTQQYMYWDPVTSNYIPAPSSTTTTSATTVNAPESTSTTQSTEDKSAAPAKKTKPQQPKTAAQIAKDMEKWAESMNKKKDVTKKPTPQVSQTSASSVTPSRPTASSSSTAPTSSTTPATSVASGFVAIESKKSADTSPQSLEAKKLNETGEESSATSFNTSDRQSSPPKQVAVEVSAENTEASTTDDESTLIDRNKLACLLCKRKFDSLDILNKHVAKSDLHKTNLEKLKNKKQTKTTPATATTTNENSNDDSDSLSAALQYRDKVVEKRKRYDELSPEREISPPRHRHESSSSSSYHQTSEKNSNTGSVAAKLMKKMGWNEGSGIGKNLQGISAPIEATMRQRGAGLGATTYEIDPNDSYKEAARKLARARFEQLNS